MAASQHIMVALDLNEAGLSGASSYTLQQAIGLAKQGQESARLTLLHVFDVPARTQRTACRASPKWWWW